MSGEPTDVVDLATSYYKAHPTTLGQADGMNVRGSRQVYANNWMTLREDSIERADGSAGVYAVIDKPTYALVIPYNGAAFHLVEQFRYPVGARRWEFPAGTAPGRAEVPTQDLAARELREETGLIARAFTLLGTVDVAPGMSSQRGHVYLATDLTVGPHAREHEEQDMRSQWWTRADFEAGIRAGVICDGQTLAAYTLFLLQRP